MIRIYMWSEDRGNETVWQARIWGSMILGGITGSYAECWAWCCHHAPEDYEHRNDLMVPKLAIKADHAWVPKQ